MSSYSRQFHIYENTFHIKVIYRTFKCLSFRSCQCVVYLMKGFQSPLHIPDFSHPARFLCFKAPCPCWRIRNKFSHQSTSLPHCRFPTFCVLLEPLNVIFIRPRSSFSRLSRPFVITGLSSAPLCLRASYCLFLCGLNFRNASRARSPSFSAKTNSVTESREILSRKERELLLCRSTRCNPRHDYYANTGIYIILITYSFIFR